MNQTDYTQTRQVQPKQTQLIVWMDHVIHDRDHGYHDSLHSIEVAQLYPQVGDFITSKVTKSLHFTQRTFPLVHS
jgi:hypothetical protein